MSSRHVRIPEKCMMMEKPEAEMEAVVSPATKQEATQARTDSFIRRGKNRQLHPKAVPPVGESASSEEARTDRKVPSLVDMCVQLAIDNIRYIGDVGETDLHLLERILPHCTLDQLKHIEDSTEGRDLSPATDKLWKNFYEKEFGAQSTNVVIKRMEQFKVSFQWKLLYEAKLKEVEEAQQKSFDKIKELYKKEDARKQSRQVRITTKVPPSSSKRRFYGGGPGSNISNVKSSLMKKSKLDFLNSREVKNLAAIKKNVVQKSHVVSSMRKPGVFSGKDCASTSKPVGRRF